MMHPRVRIVPCAQAWHARAMAEFPHFDYVLLFGYVARKLQNPSIPRFVPFRKRKRAGNAPETRFRQTPKWKRFGNASFQFWKRLL